MIFNSIQFAIFFPIAILLYFVIPQKFKNFYLLAASYFYYASYEVRYCLLLMVSTLVCYIGAKGIGKMRESKAKGLCLFACVAINLGILFVFKYLGLFLPELMKNIVLPVGISFYIFRSISYIADVYKGKIGVINSFCDYALYVSFFPQLIAGPIEQASSFFKQLYENDHSFNYERFKLGLLRMLWGYFMKLVISERLSIAVNMIYDNYLDVSGYQLVLGTVLYAFQIYTDFCSYSEIAIGASIILGFSPIENFKQPFFAVNCRDLWQRWHISLNSWFIEYVYIPLGGSKKGKLRRIINIMTVFLLSGLWHGADLSFVLWGAVSGFFQLIFSGRRVKKEMKNTVDKLCKLGGIVLTFICFNIALVFFRADDVGMAIALYERILFHFDIASIASTSLFSLGLGVFNMLFLLLALAILLVVDLLKEAGFNYEDFFKQKNLIRWGTYFALTIMILLSAHLGAAEFIYFKF